MPILSPPVLRDIGYTLFEAMGCSPQDARTVTDHLVESSLFGHDSHGTLRFYEYVYQIEDGVFNPRGRPSVVRDHSAMAVVDGGGALGQVGGHFAMELAISKARQSGVAAVALRNTSHVGRVGAYPLFAARQGLVSLAFVNAGRMGRQIAPFGGLDGKLSTNPIAFAAPRRGADPIMVDMTTAVAAEGKIRVADNTGATLPEGWIIDAESNPATDPTAYLGDPPGAMLPLGGALGYKGYCLSMVVEILGGLLSGEGCASGERKMRSNGVLFTVYDPSCFGDLAEQEEELQALVEHVTSGRIDPSLGEILIPGEPEFRTAAARGSEGIPIDETTWRRIVEAGRHLNLATDDWEAAAIG